MKNLAVIAVVLLSSCADGRRPPPVSERARPSAAAPVSAGPAAPAPAAPSTAAEARRAPVALPGAPDGEAVAGASLAGKAGGGGASGVPRVQHGTLVRDQSPAVPAIAGAVAFAAAGCATAASEEEGARFAARPPTRSAAPVVTVTALRGGASVKHDLTHACCLKASAVSRIEGKVATVTEKLAGVPCRCVCGSTLSSSVALPPGAWKIAVDVDTNGSVQRVGMYDVVVK